MSVTINPSTLILAIELEPAGGFSSGFSLGFELQQSLITINVQPSVEPPLVATDSGLTAVVKIKPIAKNAIISIGVPIIRTNPKPVDPSLYSEKNLSWLIEFFAFSLGENHKSVGLKYDNGKEVWHPGDEETWPSMGHKSKSDALLRYEEVAKNSQRLKEYEENSPANIRYWQDPVLPP